MICHGIINCNGILIRADEVLFALANTGDTCEVHLKCGMSLIVKMCLAKFSSVWNDAMKDEVGDA